MRDAPTALWCYAAVSVAYGVVGFARTVGSHPALAVALQLLALVFIFFVLRGNQIIWVLITGSYAVALLVSPISPKPWWAILFDIATLICLLAPASRKFVWRSPPSPVTPPAGLTSGEMDERSLAESGWYIDPGRPSLMRYWHADEQRWLGASRTPRKLRKQWRLQKESEKAAL